MLAGADVARYLVERDLVDGRATLSPGRHIRDVSARNRVFVVRADGVAGYVVKQADPHDVDLLAHEAAVLRELTEAEPRLTDFVPALISYDAQERVVICGLVGDATDLAAYHARGRFPPLLARGVGRALALLHTVDPDELSQETSGVSRRTSLPPDPPSLDLVLAMSDASVEVLRLLQNSLELSERLASLTGSSDEVAVVHGDMRPSNWVAFGRAGARRRTRIALVDWEFTGRGDPHLDLGAVIGEYLRAWLWSIAIVDGRDPGLGSRHARYPLTTIQPAIRAFWRGYAGAQWSRDPRLRPSLPRAVEFSAVRIAEVAFEHAQQAAQVDRRAGLALQLALNLLRRPTEAAVHLLGLPLAEAAR